MCTVVILLRPDHPWPVVIGANRDEMLERPWRPPGRHWPELPHVVGGLDVTGGGSWLAMNDEGLVACVLNRSGSLGPAPGKRSRGELALEALVHADAVEAAAALRALNVEAYRPFNMLLADNRDVFWVRSPGTESLQIRPVEPGLSMLTARDLDDRGDPRVAHNRPLFAAAEPPDPDAGDWSVWEALLGNTEVPKGSRASAAMSFRLGSGFGTGSSAMIALPAPGLEGAAPIFRFAPGPPDRTPFHPIALWSDAPEPEGDDG